MAEEGEDKFGVEIGARRRGRKRRMQPRRPPRQRKAASKVRESRTYGREEEEAEGSRGRAEARSETVVPQPEGSFNTMLVR